jgi:hypothetical protein
MIHYLRNENMTTTMSLQRRLKSQLMLIASKIFHALLVQSVLKSESTVCIIADDAIVYPLWENTIKWMVDFQAKV